MSDLSRAERDACPLCRGVATVGFLARPSVPVHQNLLYERRSAARSAVRGALDMRVCTVCGFVFNASFDPGLLEYGSRYVNSQQLSPAFSEHVDELVRRLATTPEVATGDIVEIGCGTGSFLALLLEQPGVSARAVGFDPSYVGPDGAFGGRLRFERDYYDASNAVAADAAICRHVIEHVAMPVELIRAIGSTATRERPLRLFLETPCVEWILRHGVAWDFFYEHCSLFCAESLGVTLRRGDFGNVRVDHVFGGQYLWSEACTANAGTAAGTVDTAGGNNLVALVEAFGARADVARLRAHMAGLAGDGPTMVWGAGAKGSTFCDLVDPAGSHVAAVVDLNPAKQGRYIAGTGHEIVSPQEAVRRGITTAVVLNPNYTTEVAELLVALGSSARVYDAMLERSCA